MSQNNRDPNSWGLKISAGRNMAFVNGSERLLKTASLFYEYVFSVHSLLSEKAIHEIEDLNAKGSRFVEAYEGDDVVQYHLDGDDLRSADDLPEEEGTPGKRYTLWPSYYGLGVNTETEDKPFKIRSCAAYLFEGRDKKGILRFLLSVPSTGHMHDIAYIKEMATTNSNFVEGAIDEFPGIALSNIPIFDIGGASWEQIREFREDRDVLRCMLDIRLFVRDNFEGRSLGYIQDKLGSLVARQDALSKYHGIDLYKGVLLDVLKDNALHMALTSSIFLAMTGERNAALGSAITTMAIGVGKVSVSFSQKLGENKNSDAGNPVSYLITMKEHFNG